MDAKDFVKENCKFAQNEPVSGKKILYILRGVSGSGKSTLAKQLGQGGAIFSTDDFFMKNGNYMFDPKKLSMAHDWNQKRAADAMQKSVSPIVIDNTFTQAWESKFYVETAKKFGYEIKIAEPQTEWWKKHRKDMPAEEKAKLVKDLSEKNTHGVPPQSIGKMLDRWEHNLTEEQILQSKNPFQR